MNSILLNHKISSFMKTKENEIFRGKSVDQMIEELASEGRNHSAY